MYEFWFKKERGMYMRRSIKKAVAFALATATVVTSLGVTQPVKAAEYSDAREVLPIEYDWATEFGDSALFVRNIDAAKDDEEEKYFVDEIALVDKNGEKKLLEVKAADGKYKYKRVSHISGDYVALIREDDSYEIYASDGTWFGKGESKYDEIYPMWDGNYCVQVGNTANIVDKMGKIIVGNVFEMREDTFIWVYSGCENYKIIQATDWLEDETVVQAKIYDKIYKEIKGVDLASSNYGIVFDNKLAVYKDKDVTIYDSQFNKVDFEFELKVDMNPSVSADVDKVLTDYEIRNVFDVYDNKTGKDLLAIYTRDIYVNAFGEKEYFDKTRYFDLDTNKEISEADVDRDSIIGCEIENTDLTYDLKNGFYKIYYGKEKVVDSDSILQFIKKKYENICSMYIPRIIGNAGNLYVDIWAYDINNKNIDCVVLLEKSSDFALEKAKYFDKSISMSSDCCGGYIEFEDGITIINGKEYKEDVEVQLIYAYGNYDKTKYYVATVEKDGKTTSTLYDKNHKEVYVSKDKIRDIIADVNIIVTKDVEVEGYSYPVRKYGCVSFTKTLVSNEDVLEELEDIEEGEKVVVEIKKDVPMKAEIFETIKGKDIEVEVKLDNGMSWNINGKNVESEKLIDVNLTVDVVENVVPVAAIEKVELKGEKIELSLAHTGDFGFTAELKMNVKPENAGKFANRFFYNPDTKQLEFQVAVKIDEKGDAIFTYTHASDYVIILSDVAYEAPVNTQKPDETVKPGDMTNIGLLVGLLGVGAVAFISQKKKIYM